MMQHVRKCKKLEFKSVQRIIDYLRQQQLKIAKIVQHFSNYLTTPNVFIRNHNEKTRQIRDTIQNTVSPNILKRYYLRSMSENLCLYELMNEFSSNLTTINLNVSPNHGSIYSLRETSTRFFEKDKPLVKGSMKVLQKYETMYSCTTFSVILLILTCD